MDLRKKVSETTRVRASYVKDGISLGCYDDKMIEDRLCQIDYREGRLILHLFKDNLEKNHIEIVDI